MENKKIITYLDSGANINCLKKHWKNLEFIRYPYDGDNRPKRENKKWEPLVAKPSCVKWKDDHLSWEEDCSTWAECTGSKIYPEICSVVGFQKEKDILHLDSAYKSKAQIFLTSDKGDIISKRNQLEKICVFKIFNPVKECVELISYINFYLTK